MSAQFVQVSAKRETPYRELWAVLLEDEWEKLELLAAQLPKDLTWEATPVDSQNHKSQSARVSPEGQQ